MGKLTARLALFAAALLVAWSTALAQAERATEPQVKAAYLYQFGGFVEWPPRAFADPAAPFAIGVIGAPQVAAELEKLAATRSVQGRRLAVRRLEPGEDLSGLHVVFIGREADELPAIAAAARERAILVVSDADEALAHGAMIHFVTVGSRIRFDVALAPARQAELRISSRLLSVARRVRKG